MSPNAPVILFTMGSYYDLRVGGYSVLSSKWSIDAEVLSLFVEADKREARSAPDLPNACANVGDCGEFIGYCSTVTAIADRLDIMGFTLELSRSQFSLLLAAGVKEERESAQEWRRREDDETCFPLYDDAQRKIRLLSDLSFEKWVESVRRLMKDSVRWPTSGSNYQAYSRRLDRFEAHILNDEDDHPPLGFYCADLRFLIRALLACCAPTEIVVLDCTDMVQAGYFDRERPLAAEARLSIAAEARAVEKILVLTEGTSDSKLLRETLAVVYPHLREFLSFLDHQQFSVAGGAGNLLNLLRGFAGAGVSNRVLALFDNDTAGSVQLAKAKKMTLPENFRVLQLPHLPFAEFYPTIGPTGCAETDINGLACSIELYLGSAALAEESGALMPVRWGARESSLSRYQGELVDKQAVQQRYLAAIRVGRADTTSMELVFRQILSAFHD